MQHGATDPRLIHDGSHITRREVLRRGSAAALGVGLLSAGAGRVAANTFNLEAFADVDLPPDMGQANLAVYVEETGHTLRGSFLDYWRANGAASVFGNPISEPFASEDGYYSQAFENIILQYRPEYLYTHDPIMRPMPIGKQALQAALPNPFHLSPGHQLGAGGRHRVGGRGRLSAAAEPLSPTDPAVTQVVNDGGRYIEETGHTISRTVFEWYRMNEGWFYFGHPLSEPYADDGRMIQYFEGAIVVEGPDGVGLAPLAAELAPRLEIDTTPVERGDLPLYDELRFWTADNPNPLGDPYAPGPKWIGISIPKQTLWAYHGYTQISSTLVSTGLPPNRTQRGFFHVRLKFPTEDMAGFTSRTGEVLGFGDAPPGTIPYQVRDVPNVVYFSTSAEALHGAYWHNNFGQKMSHGCVNLPLDFAAWLYGWAPLGTEVWIYE